MAASRFDNFIQKSMSSIGRKLSHAKAQIVYNFWKNMHDNEVAKSANPASTAVHWYKSYSKDTDVQLKREFMKQAHLYIFDYPDPKYKDILKFFDTQPLVLCLGQTTSVEYSKNNIGINLHLLPPKVRRLVLFEVWRLYSTAFKKNLYTENTKEIQIPWEMLKKHLEKYGIGFAVRTYIPPRQKNVIEFRYEDWSKAIWIPSAGYSKITAPELEKEWRAFVNKDKTTKSIVGGEGHSSSV